MRRILIKDQPIVEPFSVGASLRRVRRLLKAAKHLTSSLRYGSLQATSPRQDGNPCSRLPFLCPRSNETHVWATLQNSNVFFRQCICSFSDQGSHAEPSDRGPARQHLEPIEVEQNVVCAGGARSIGHRIGAQGCTNLARLAQRSGVQEAPIPNLLLWYSQMRWTPPRQSSLRTSTNQENRYVGQISGCDNCPDALTRCGNPIATGER